MPADDILRERLGPDGFSTSDFRDNHRIVVPADKLHAALEALKERAGFDYLVDITAVDYLHYPEAVDRFGVIYILCNTATGEQVIGRTHVKDKDTTLTADVPQLTG